MKKKAIHVISPASFTRSGYKRHAAWDNMGLSYWANSWRNSYPSEKIIKRTIEFILKRYIGVQITLPEGFEVKNYFDTRGSRLSTRLIKLVGKKKIFADKKHGQKVMALVCQKLDAFYDKPMELYLSWGDKNLLGEGEYEGEETCFSDNGENAISKYFMAGTKRVKVLVTRDVDGEPKGRVIVYFAGGREVYFTNFYHYELPCDYEQFKDICIKLFEQYMGMKFRRVNVREDVPLGSIYLNSDGVRLRAKRPFRFDTLGIQRNMFCPECGTTRKENKMHFRNSDDITCIVCNSSGESRDYREDDEDELDYTQDAIPPIPMFNIEAGLNDECQCPMCVARRENADGGDN